MEIGSTLHLMMKFLTFDRSVIIIHVDQKTAKECYVASLRIGKLTLGTITLKQTNKGKKITCVAKGKHTLNLNPRAQDEIE